MRVFRVLDFVGVALMLGFLGAAAVVRFKDLEMRGLAFRVAHLLAGGLVLMSFLLLYQTRLYALLNVFAAQPRCCPLRWPGRLMFRAPMIST
jgi:hypothetical protein